MYGGGLLEVVDTQGRHSYILYFRSLVEWVGGFLY